MYESPSHTVKFQCIYMKESSDELIDLPLWEEREKWKYSQTLAYSGLELAMWPSTAWNLQQSPCSRLPSTKFMGELPGQACFSYHFGTRAALSDGDTEEHACRRSTHLNKLFLSSLARCRYLAPVLSWLSFNAVRNSSGTGVT